MDDLGLRRAIYYRLSPRWRRRARRLAFAPLDAVAALRGGHTYNGIRLPLRGEIFTGGGDFLAVGLRFRAHFQELGGLRPSDDVLEVGSGQGRMAIPLTDYLSAAGSYVGFDIVPSAVDDCRQRISTRYPAFRFIHLPVANDLYTDDGLTAASVTFPFDDDAFDFAFATSVFSHMEPAAIETYLRETRRVLRPGGRFLATLFLMDDEAERTSTSSHFRFPHREGDAFYMTLRPRSANVAIIPEAFAAMASQTGWANVETHPGSWSGRSGPTLDYQDIVVLG